MNGTTINILQHLPPYQGDTKLLQRRQDTFDIVREILNMHRKTTGSYDRISDFFWKGSAEATARALFDFLKQNVPYVVETTNFQSTKEPQAIIAEAPKYGGDCKHYASFIVGVANSLQRKGYPIHAYYRFASYKSSKSPGHVFAIIEGPDGNEMWVDPVLPYFNQRNPAPQNSFNKRPDAKVTTTGRIGELYAISGVETKPIPGGTQISVSGVPHWLDQFYNRLPAVIQGPEEIGKFTLISKKKRDKLKNKLKKINPGKIFKKLVGAAPRNAYLSLVKLNFANLAVKMFLGIKNPKNKQKLMDKWASLGGNTNKLHTAITQGVKLHNKLHKKKQIKGIGDISEMGDVDGNTIYGMGNIPDILSHDQIGWIFNRLSPHRYTPGDYQAIGFVPDEFRMNASVGFAPAAIPALLTAAAPIIAALKNILKSFKGPEAEAGPDDQDAKNLDDATAKADTDITDMHNDAVDKDQEDSDGVVTHGKGKHKIKTKVTDNDQGGQDLNVTDEGGDDDDSADKTMTKKGNKDGGGGIKEAFGTAWEFAKDHKWWFIAPVAVTGLVLVIKAIKGKKRRR